MVPHHATLTQNPARRLRITINRNTVRTTCVFIKYIFKLFENVNTIVTLAEGVKLSLEAAHVTPKNWKD